MGSSTIGNPITFTDTLEAITRNLTVDESWKTGSIRSLEFSLRGLDSKKVKFLTLPLDHYENVPSAGSVNIIDEKQAKQLWKAVSDDKLAPYLKKYPDDELPDPKDVS